MPKEPDDPLDPIVVRAAESIFEASDEEVREELREQGIDPDEAGEHVRDVLLGALQRHRKERMAKARAEYERRREELESVEVELPPTKRQRSQLLLAALHQQPWLQGMLTVHHRELDSLSDEDVIGYLEQLALLGVLDEL